MGDSSNSKPGFRSGKAPSPQAPAAARDKTTPADDPGAGRAGRVIHDARGNAVWDWVKDTTRVAIDSTSRLLRRLEVPDLKMEDSQEQELRVESDRDPGGGYDPYGAASSGKPPGAARGGMAGGTGSGKGNSTPNRSADPWRTGGANSSRGGTSNPGGGYDPYGKNATIRKTPRKP